MLSRFKLAHQSAIKAIESLECGNDEPFLAIDQWVKSTNSKIRGLPKREAMLCIAEGAGYVSGLMRKLPAVIIQSPTRHRRYPD